MSDEGMMNAAKVMRDAADRMNQAASNLDYSLQQQRNFMDDWLNRLEHILEKKS